jgi:hypothetical protein
VLLRGRLAALLDCYGAGTCCQNPALCQALLDKLLYDTDRAIDLYALGSNTNGNGEPEWRAAAYGLLVNSFLNPVNSPNNPLLTTLQVLDCFNATCLPTIGTANGLQPTLAAIRDAVLNATTLLPIAMTTLDLPADARRIMADELCIQRRSEQQWGNLLGTMAPSCIDADRARVVITQLLDDALARANAQPCADIEPPIPPTVAESVSLFNDVRTWTNTLPVAALRRLF